jgi:phosphate transport system permease protein
MAANSMFGEGAGRRRRRDRIGDRVLYGLCAAAAIAAALVLLEIAYQVVTGAHLAIAKYGLTFLGHVDWRPNENIYGAGAIFFGTAVTSGIALLIAAPLGVAIGLYLSELASRRVRAVVGPLVEMLAAIPSVILGFWGLIVLAPFVKDHVQPWLHDNLGFIPLFGEPQSNGASLFTAGLILAIMVLPIVSAISREVIATVPVEHKEAALALGATRWEMIRMAVLPYARAGISGAAMLGLGRAIGETIAVTIVIGNAPVIGDTIFSQGYTLAAVIANEFGEAASDPTHRAALIAAGLVLFVLTLLVNAVARYYVNRASRPATVPKGMAG